MTESIYMNKMNNSLSSVSDKANANEYSGQFYYILLFPFLMYSYNISLQEYWAPSIILLCAFVICSGTLLLMSLNSLQSVRPITLCWLIILLIMLRNNYDLKYGHWSTVYSTVFPIILVIILQISKKWFAPANVLMLLFTAEHVFFTWLFYFIPQFYLSKIVPIFSTVSQIDLINEFKDGCMAGLTEHYSTDGMYLSIGSLLIFCLLFKKGYWQNHKKSWVIFLFLTVGALLLTGKRGPTLFAVAAAIITYMIFNKHPFKSVFKFAAFFIAMIAIFSILTNFVPALSNVVNRFMDQGNTDITNGRIGLYQYAWMIFLKNPWFGIGWRGYLYEFQNSALYWGEPVDTHNVYIQLLCETGIVGTVVIMGVVFSTLRLTFQGLSNSRNMRVVLSSNEEYYLAVSLAIQLFFIGYCITGNPLYDVQTFYPYIFACAYSYAIRLGIAQKIKGGTILCPK